MTKNITKLMKIDTFQIVKMNNKASPTKHVIDLSGTLSGLKPCIYIPYIRYIAHTAPPAQGLINTNKQND